MVCAKQTYLVPRAPCSSRSAAHLMRLLSSRAVRTFPGRGFVKKFMRPPRASCASSNGVVWVRHSNTPRLARVGGLV